jgi:hypothetical protein
MKDTPKRHGIVTLNYCVSRYFNEASIFDPKPNEKRQALQFAVDCFLHLNIFQPHSVKVAYLEVNEAMNAELPSDFVRYTKIGMNEGGRIRTLTYDPSMIVSTEYRDGKPSHVKKEPNKPFQTIEFIDHVKNGQYIGGMYAQGGGYNDNYYRVDRERGVISLQNSLNCRELVLEYISTGINTQTDTIVPIEAVPTIVAYIHMIKAENTPGVPMNKQMFRRDTYERAYSSLSTLRLLFTADEYLDMVYSTYSQSPTR